MLDICWHHLSVRQHTIVICSLLRFPSKMFNSRWEASLNKHSSFSMSRSVLNPRWWSWNVLFLKYCNRAMSYVLIVYFNFHRTLNGYIDKWSMKILKIFCCSSDRSIIILIGQNSTRVKMFAIIKVRKEEDAGLWQEPKGGDLLWWTT